MDWWTKFTSIVAFTIPYGNGGRGTDVKLFVLCWIVVAGLGLAALGYYEV